MITKSNDGETLENVVRELSNMGYSKKAIQEILKWIPASR